MSSNKQANLAGPGISTYEEVAKILPLSIGGGIGQSRTYMLLLRKAHLGEVSVTVWPGELKRICAERDIHVLESARRDRNAL